MSETTESIEAGQRVGSPFSSLFKNISEARQRRQQEEDELEKAVKLLGAKAENDEMAAERESKRAIIQEGEKFKLEEKLEKVKGMISGDLPMSQELIEEFGLAPKSQQLSQEPSIQTDEEGNVPVSMTQGVLEQSGIAYSPGRTKKLKEQRKTDLEIMTMESKLKEDERKESVRIDNIRDNAEDKLKLIRDIKKDSKYFGVPGIIPGLPSTKKRTFDSRIDKLLSQEILDLMNEMKESSKTGATGFGQLSNKELEVLKNASTELKKTLKKEDAEVILNKMESTISKFLGEEKESVDTEDIDKELDEINKELGL